jgi:alkyldihydroxyacetonephosphate synthase
MTFDPIAWAVRHGAVPGSPVERAPAVTSVGAMFVDAHSWLCAVDPALAAVTVEARLREEDLTLGLFPERYEVASVGELVEADEPGAGARGAGFRTLLRGTEDGLLLLDVRRRPEAQSGRGLLIESFAAGCEALRVLAQTDVVPAISLLADPAAADLLLEVAGDPDRARATLGDGRALMIVIAAGRQGEAAARAERAIAACASCISADLGQNVARAWASSRYDLPEHAATLGAAGYRLETSRQWHRWSRLPGALAEPPAGAWCGREVFGVSGQGAVLQDRILSAAG